MLLALIGASMLSANGLGEHGEDLYAREKFDVSVSGYMRARGSVMDNFDLDRGLTPSGRPLYPVPYDNSQLLESADMRLRTDLALYAPFAAAAVKVRADLIDNLTLGATPVLSNGSGPIPTAGATTAQLPTTLLRLKRAYGEVVTPIGYFAAGRMGNTWGLGILSNGGDCLDCDHGDAADRIMFATPLLGHIWAVAFDFDAIGPLSTEPRAPSGWILEPAANVRSLSVAILNPRTPLALERRRKGGKTTVEYGLAASYRWQDSDVPAGYTGMLQAGMAGTSTTSPIMVPHGFKAALFDGWLKISGPWGRFEAEGAVGLATLAQPSQIPGVLLRDSVNSFQWGGAAELEFGTRATRFQGGVQGGVASGDPAPGFGAFPQANVKPVKGEFDPPQINLPKDTRLDNLRFSPDYRIDTILFASIVGTVTDCIYARPFVSMKLVELASAVLKARLSATYTRAIYAASTPGGDPNLGVEGNAALRWEARDGFDALLEYAVLFPLAGLSNPDQGLPAQPAQLVRLRLAWVF
jgi:uncharacterized protein (TIGR04551 family)